MRNLQLERGQIVNIDLCTENKEGSEQRGFRPCVIIGNNIGNKYSPCIIVSPITKADKKAMPTHVNLDCEKYRLVDGSRILTEQIITVSKSRITKFIDSLTNEDIINLNNALAISLQIN
ncbi:type II toxin-antitoxin system PemK/MazF family toxin [Clostridium sp.]|uniref:type II toxin-antitoxin system PemK/MazF family toxin n=1 Tax=Clostridium sp. TaxID=1506 RepID=UPI002FC99505